MMKKRFAILLLTLAAFSSSLWAASPSTVRFNDEATDTTKINALLDEASSLRLQSPNAWVSHFAHKLEGTPYKAATLEFEPEQLTVNMAEMDCTTFLENVLALALAAENRRWSWRDFITYLQQLRYRSGEVDGYTSRLHYMSDWVIDNSSRGLVRDFTSVVGTASYMVKTLDFMTMHRDQYPALKDEAQFVLMKQREQAYRGHRYPYIKKSGIRAAKLRDGDIVMFVSNTKGLDISHVGFVTLDDNGVPHLLHASSKEGRVVVEKRTLPEYLNKQTGASGVRILRLSE